MHEFWSAVPVWAFACSAGVLTFAAGGAWFELRRVRQDMSAMWNKIDARPECPYKSGAP